MTERHFRAKAVQLDRVDRRILELLQVDGKLSNQEIAERVALSPSPCLRRIRRLEEAGVIRQYVALLDPGKLGLGLLAYATVRLQKHGDTAKRSPVDTFRAAVETWPEVIACYAMTGEMDYLLRVEVEDLEHYSRFVMGHLLKHPAVVDVKSSFALERIKETTALPVPN
jgi:Lrp/AsnC family transcriptional regulator, leucine-responsive regulatory protein